jgi:Flp pilus assembly protein TadG
VKFRDCGIVSILSRSLAGLAHERRGSIAVNFAVALPVLLCLCGVALDYGNLFVKQSRLQAVADAAAIAGARELTLPNVKRAQIQSAIASSVGYHNSQTHDVISHTASVNFELAEVAVELNEDWTPFFAHFIDAGVTPIKVAAKARLLHAQEKICVLALHPAVAKAVHLS